MLFREPEEKGRVSDMRRCRPVDASGFDTERFANRAEEAHIIHSVCVGESAVNVKYGQTGHRCQLLYDLLCSALGVRNCNIKMQHDAHLLF